MEESALTIKKELLLKISKDLAWRYKVIPLDQNEKEFHFIIEKSMPLDQIANELTVLFDRQILLHPESEKTVLRLLNTHYRNEETADRPAGVTRGNPESFVETMVMDAYELKSSDIHVEKYEKECRVRFRIDGQLIQRHRLEPNDFPSLVNKIKIRANLDISEKRLPQDGRIHFLTEGKKIRHQGLHPPYASRRESGAEDIGQRCITPGT